MYTGYLNDNQMKMNVAKEAEHAAQHLLDTGEGRTWSPLIYHVIIKHSFETYKRK